MKTYGGVNVQINVFLTSALAGGEWSASRPGRFTPGESAPPPHRYPLDRSMSGPQSRFEIYGEVTILDPTGVRIPTTA
jgi:hypothetical protein